MSIPSFPSFIAQTFAEYKWDFAETSAICINDELCNNSAGNKINKNIIISFHIRKGILSEICTWSLRVSASSSLHAVPWVGRVPNRALRTVIFAFAVAVMIGLPIVVVYEMVSYANETKVRSGIEYREALEGMNYPNVTVCHPKYFDVRKFESKMDRVFYSSR